MKSIHRKILVHGGLIFGLTAVCLLAAIYTEHRHRERNPAVPAFSAAAEAPVIVLDAGHGEST